MKPDNIELRDWFAGMALQGELAAQDFEYGMTWTHFEAGVAKRAYEIADAMMAARAKNAGSK